jgi:pimeloyl-ACP methyl ester carboxylesterase
MVNWEMISSPSPRTRLTGSSRGKGKPPARRISARAHELVLLHGQPGTAEDWQAVLAQLPAHLHTVAVDHPGYVASRHPAAGFKANALWRAFLTERRALLNELADLETALPSIDVPVLLLADPADQIVPTMTAHQLASELPDARLRLVEHAGRHLPRRAPGVVAEAITGFLAAIDDRQSVPEQKRVKVRRWHG